MLLFRLIYIIVLVFPYDHDLEHIIHKVEISDFQANTTGNMSLHYLNHMIILQLVGCLILLYSALIFNSYFCYVLP